MELLFIIFMLSLLCGDDKPKKRKHRHSWWQSPSYTEYDRWWHDNPSNQSGWH